MFFQHVREIWYIWWWYINCRKQPLPYQCNMLKGSEMISHSTHTNKRQNKSSRLIWFLTGSLKSDHFISRSCWKSYLKGSRHRGRLLGWKAPDSAARFNIASLTGQQVNHIYRYVAKNKSYLFDGDWVILWAVTVVVSITSLLDMAAALLIDISTPCCHSFSRGDSNRRKSEGGFLIPGKISNHQF